MQGMVNNWHVWFTLHAQLLLWLLLLLLVTNILKYWYTLMVVCYEVPTISCYVYYDYDCFIMIKVLGKGRACIPEGLIKA